MNNDATIFPPGALSEQQILMCLSVIEEGNAVDLESARRELPLATVVVKRDDGNVVAVGAIKQRRPEYASTVSKRSGFPFDKNIRELGYVAVRESHRKQGLADEIAAVLLSGVKDRPIFGTTSHDGMKRILEKAGFIRRGKEWAGRRKDLLSLWIKT